METGALIPGIVLICLGVSLVVFTVFWEVGQFGKTGLYMFAILIAGFGFILLGQWLIQ